MPVISVYHLLWICICALGALVLRMCYQHWRTTKALEQRIRDNLATRAPVAVPPVPIRPPPPPLPGPPPSANLFGTSAEDAPEATPLEEVLARAQRAAEARVPVSQVPPPRMASLRVAPPVVAQDPGPSAPLPPVVAPDPEPMARVDAPAHPPVAEVAPEPAPAVVGTEPEPPSIVETAREPAAPPVDETVPEPTPQVPAPVHPPIVESDPEPVEAPPSNPGILTDPDSSNQSAPIELLPEPRGPVNWPSFPPPVEVEGDAPDVPEAPALPPLPQDPIERLEALARARSSGRAVLREPVRGIRSNPLVVSTPIEHDEEPTFEPQPGSPAPAAEPAPPASPAAPRPPARTLAAFYSAYESVTPPAKREDPAEVLRRALAQAHAETPPAEPRPPAKKLSFRKSPPK